MATKVRSPKNLIHLMVNWNATESFEPETIAAHAEKLHEYPGPDSYVWWGKFSKTGKLGLTKKIYDQVKDQLRQGLETHLYLYSPNRPSHSFHVGLVKDLQQAWPSDPERIPLFYSKITYSVPYWFRLADIREVSVEHFRELVTLDGHPLDPVASNLYPLPVRERSGIHLFDYSQTRGRRWWQLQGLHIRGGASPAVDPNFVFVLMPFAKEFDDTWQLGIKPAVESLGLTCKRADDFLHVREIMEVIRENIRAARLLVAEMTTSNPNVFYELGFAHALGKPVILITKDRNTVPFDLRAINNIQYASIHKLRDDLSKMIAALL